MAGLGPGPFAAMLLADLGADVVKVEKPDGGDDMRHWPPMSEKWSATWHRCWLPRSPR